MIKKIFQVFVFLISIPLFADCGERYGNTIVADSVVVHKDIWYGGAYTSDGVWKDFYLNFYEPYNDSVTDRPLLLFLHGGTFLGGSPNDKEAIYPCYEMARRGYACATLSYRTEANPLSLIFPDRMIKAVMRGVQDAKAGIRYFYRIAKDSSNVYGIDTNQIYIGGSSAGGIVAMHCAYMDDIAELEPAFRGYANELGGLDGNSGNAGYSVKVRGVVEISGALRDPDYMNNNTNIPMVSIHNNSDLAVPSRRGKPYLIPTLPIVFGSIYLHEHATQLGMYNPLYIVPGLGHVPYKSNEDESPVQPVYDSTMTLIATFLYNTIACNPNNVITPVRNNTLEVSVLVFPNPSNDIINIKVDEEGDYALQIFDIYGKLINETNLFQHQTRISLGALNIESGYYFFKINNRNTKSSKTIQILYNKN